MKLMTISEASAKISKDIIKQINSNMKEMKEEPSFSVPVLTAISKCFSVKNGVETNYSSYNYGCKDSVDFVPVEELYEQASLSDQIMDGIRKGIKDSKKVLMIPVWDRKTKWGMYSSRDYDILKRIIFIKPCKEFGAINKKLVKLGLKEIDPLKWRNEDVSGKRGSIYYSASDYFCTRPDMCNKVLAYLKGKKKVSYDYKNLNHLEDREYGERYETEWSGSVEHNLVFTDAKGKATVIY